MKAKYVVDGCGAIKHRAVGGMGGYRRVVKMIPARLVPAKRQVLSFGVIYGFFALQDLQFNNIVAPLTPPLPPWGAGAYTIV